MYRSSLAMKPPGFTLIELIITVAIAAVVVVVGIPMFRETVSQNRLTATVNNFVTALNLTRSEAIKRGTRVTLCKSTDGATCAVTGGYEQGWIVFVDAPPMAERDADNTQELLVRVYERLSGVGLTLTGNAMVSDYVSYDSSGVARLKTGAFQAGTLTLCESPMGRQVVLGSAGRIRTETVSGCGGS